MTDIGINFRATAGYVTDDAGQTYCLESSDAYPTSRAGETFGWEVDNLIESANRDSALDPRLAGINFEANSGTPSTFRLDVDTGDHDIRVALGDAGSSQAYQYALLEDTSTTITTIDDSNGTGADQWTDATGVTRTSDTDWINNNAAYSHTFSTTIFRLDLGTPTSQSNSSTLAHLELASTAAPGPVPQRLMIASYG